MAVDQNWSRQSGVLGCWFVVVAVAVLVELMWGWVGTGRLLAVECIW